MTRKLLLECGRSQLNCLQVTGYVLNVFPSDLHVVLFPDSCLSHPLQGHLYELVNTFPASKAQALHSFLSVLDAF